MSLHDRIQDDLKQAMRAGDNHTRDTLRMVFAELKNKRIEVGRDLEDPEELKVLQRAVKTRADSAAQYEEAGRPELAEQERAETEVIERYLPARMSDEDVRALVEQAIAEVGAASKADLGKVMKAVMAAQQGQVDGKTVQRFAAELLADA